MSVDLSKGFLSLSDVSELLGFRNKKTWHNNEKALTLLRAFERRTGKKIVQDFGTDKKPRYFCNTQAVKDFFDGGSNNSCLAEDMETMRVQMQELKERVEALEAKQFQQDPGDV